MDEISKYHLAIHGESKRIMNPLWKKIHHRTITNKTPLTQNRMGVLENVHTSIEMALISCKSCCLKYFYSCSCLASCSLCCSDLACYFCKLFELRLYSKIRFYTEWFFFCIFFLDTSRSVKASPETAEIFFQKLRNKYEFTILVTLKQAHLNSGVIFSIHHLDHR